MESVVAEIETADGQLGIARIVFSIWEWFENFVSAFWTGLEWPHAALAIFVIVALLFKKELQSLIPRITSVGAAGVSLSSVAIPNQQPATSNNIEAMSAGAEAVGSEFPTLMKVTSDSVETALAEMKDDGAKVPFLKNQLSYWKAMYVFENFYSSIFGGQIKILRFLNGFGFFGCQFEKVRVIWEEHAQANLPLMEDWSLDTYLSFIFETGLAQKQGEKLVITPLGNEFLVWMTKFRKLDAKPL